MRKLCLSIVLLATVSATAAAQGKALSAAEQALIQTNAALLEALRTGDSASLASSLAADLTFTDASGSALSKSQLLANIARGYRVQLSAPRDVTASIDGNLGTVAYESSYATSAGESAVVRTKSVYVMRAGHWQLMSHASTGGPAPVTAVITPTVPAVVVPTGPAIVIPAVPKGKTLTARASGTFQPDVKPLAPYNTSAEAGLGRFSIDKKFHGDLEATSKGEMLSAGKPTGSGAYVAIEYVTGTLNGRKGSFALQHTGIMNRGTPTLTVSVVPDSGTGELTGLAGTMNIILEGSKHSYVFDYSLPGGR